MFLCDLWAHLSCSTPDHAALKKLNAQSLPPTPGYAIIKVKHATPDL